MISRGDDVTALVIAERPASAALHLERRAADLLFDGENKREAVRAFLEKRRPTFAGRGRVRALGGSDDKLSNGC